MSHAPKISDFGLAKWEHTAGNFSKRGHVVGTTGYVAPEYADNGQLYVKSNVYSFGGVLVEMLTGLRAIDKRRPLGQRNLVAETLERIEAGLIKLDCYRKIAILSFRC